jgi:hypothetical protein
MKTTVIFWLFIVMLISSGCASRASDAQLGEMCQNKLEVTGALRGTVYKTEAERITQEYAQKEKGLKDEMNRDLTGMDDVLSSRLKSIEAASSSDDEKAEKIAAANADIEKKKKDITDQFENLLSKLTPQRDYALKEAKAYVEKRMKNADETKQKCILQGKEAEVKESTAICRIQAKSTEAYDGCK